MNAYARTVPIMKQPKFSTRDYEMVADVLNKARLSSDYIALNTEVKLLEIVSGFVRVFGTDNPRFNAGKFILACGVADKPENKDVFYYGEEVGAGGG